MTVRLTPDMGEPIVQKMYLRRGYFPDDAESAYRRWRATAALVGPNDPFEQFVKSIWFVGWRTRGEFDYGEPDLLTKDDAARCRRVERKGQRAL